MIDKNKKYIFKKDYICSMGKINEGREVTYFNNTYFLDGIIIPEPYATDIRRIFDNEDFVKNYIKEENIIKNKV